MLYGVAGLSFDGRTCYENAQKRARSYHSIADLARGGASAGKANQTYGFTQASGNTYVKRVENVENTIILIIIVCYAKDDHIDCGGAAFGGLRQDSRGLGK